MANKDIVKLILDKRVINKDGRHPVKIRVTYNRKQQYYSVKDNLNKGLSFTPGEFEKVMEPNSRGTNRDYRKIINNTVNRAEEIIQNMPVFTFEGFKKSFSNKGKNKDVFSFFSAYIDELKKYDRINYASTYEATQKTLKIYHKKKKFLFDDLTVKYLKNFELYLKADNKSVTTISIHMRNIRRIFNLAIKQGAVKAELYPFGDDKSDLYQIPESQNIKKALSKDLVRKIIRYKPLENSPEHFYRDLWVFSYLCNGMNMADILRLKYSDIDNDNISFIRHKTSYKWKNRPIQVTMLPQTKQIIERWGTKPVLSSNYIFSILTDGLTAEQEVKKIKQETKQVNKYIKRIAEKVGINANVSTYTARHSFASVLKLSGENVAFISEAMGHSDIKTTENYLSSFNDKQRKKAAKKLL
ncbi:MAG: site-specific integrase [Candidatus Cloacimonadota bacterium]|nr:site-specific integrase [Candidatus Cloacimonadota bacterium]